MHQSTHGRQPHHSCYHHRMDAHLTRPLDSHRGGKRYPSRLNHHGLYSYPARRQQRRREDSSSKQTMDRHSIRGGRRQSELLYRLRRAVLTTPCKTLITVNDAATLNTRVIWTMHHTVAINKTYITCGGRTTRVGRGSDHLRDGIPGPRTKPGPDNLESSQAPSFPAWSLRGRHGASSGSQRLLVGASRTRDASCGELLWTIAERYCNTSPP